MGRVRASSGKTRARLSRFYRVMLREQLREHMQLGMLRGDCFWQKQTEIHREEWLFSQTWLWLQPKWCERCHLSHPPWWTAARTLLLISPGYHCKRGSYHHHLMLIWDCCATLVPQKLLRNAQNQWECFGWPCMSLTRTMGTFCLHDRQEWHVTDSWFSLQRFETTEWCVAEYSNVKDWERKKMLTQLENYDNACMVAMPMCGNYLQHIEGNKTSERH